MPMEHLKKLFQRGKPESTGAFTRTACRWYEEDKKQNAKGVANARACMRVLRQFLPAEVDLEPAELRKYSLNYYCNGSINDMMSVLTTVSMACCLEGYS